MTHNEQLQAWVEGRSIHDTESDQCVPDFSCCQPDLLVDEKTRKAFAEAGEVLRMSFLGTFLSKAFNKAGSANVYIAGVDEPGQTSQ